MMIRNNSTDMKAIQLFIILFLPFYMFSQQIADTTYQPIIQNPEYELAKGPVVFLDEAHLNFYTKNGRYKAFSNLLPDTAWVFEKETLRYGVEGWSQGAYKN